MASTGCTPAQAWNEWDLPSIVAQARYWQKHPPTHQLIAAYMQYKPGASSASSGSVTPSGEADPAVVQAFMAMAPEMPEHMRPNIPNPYSRRPHVRH